MGSSVLLVSFCFTTLFVLTSATSEQFFQTNIHTILLTISLTSSVLLIIAAVLHSWLPQTEEKCIFHVALNQSLYYLWRAGIFFLMSYVHVGFFADYCVTLWCLFLFVVLSSFMWSTVLSYHLWKTIELNFNEFNHTCRHLMMGYGIPALLLALYYVRLRYEKNDWNLSCAALIESNSSAYVFFLMIFISLAHLVFFGRVRRRLKNVQYNSQEYSVTTMEKLRVRLSLSKRLFSIVILPWVIAFVTPSISQFEPFLWRSALVCLAVGLLLISLSGGIIMFVVLVLSRRNLQNIEVLSENSTSL